MQPILFLFLFPLLLPFTNSANPVKAPIIRNALNVYTRPLAQLPYTSTGRPSKILCMVPLSRTLYVCTSTIIYAISRRGTVSPFLDVARAFQQDAGRSLNLDSGVHGGLRSLAFHPQFRANRRFYVSALETRPGTPADFHYVSDVPNPIRADSVVVEFRCEKHSMRVRQGSYRLLFRVGMPVFDHPVKQIAFFRQFLYVAHGDGSVQSASAGGGQRNDALGKILRIDPLPTGGKPYGIPFTNPFRKHPKMPSEVFALGFRNPHNICFGKDGTLYAADSGRANVEEVNLVQRGRNYGWSRREGTFVHTGGGLLSGVRGLPKNDDEFGFEYPVVQVGHEGNVGARFIGQAIAGGCPVQNGSPMSGKYWYSDFPESGKLYFSNIGDMKRAKTRGKVDSLTQAATKQAVIWFSRDGREKFTSFESLGDAMRSEWGFQGEKRVDVRFGRGSRGELYWSSKTTGRVYLFTSSLPGGPGGVPMRGVEGKRKKVNTKTKRV